MQLDNLAKITKKGKKVEMTNSVHISIQEADKNKCCKAILGKVKKIAATYGRSVAEFIDFIKDVSYAYNVQHANFTTSLLLWIFSLFAIIYTTVAILFMTESQYCEEFGH